MHIPNSCAQHATSAKKHVRRVRFAEKTNSCSSPTCSGRICRRTAVVSPSAARWHRSSVARTHRLPTTPPTWSRRAVRVAGTTCCARFPSPHAPDAPPNPCSGSRRAAARNPHRFAPRNRLVEAFVGVLREAGEAPLFRFGHDHLAVFGLPRLGGHVHAVNRRERGLLGTAAFAGFGHGPESSGFGGSCHRLRTHWESMDRPADTLRVSISTLLRKGPRSVPCPKGDISQ